MRTPSDAESSIAADFLPRANDMAAMLLEGQPIEVVAMVRGAVLKGASMVLEVTYNTSGAPGVSLLLATQAGHRIPVTRVSFVAEEHAHATHGKDPRLCAH